MNRRILSVSLAAVLATSLPTSAGADSSPAIAAESPKAINLTNVPGPDGGVAWGRAEGVVAARTERVLSVLQDYGHYVGLFPHFQKSKVLSKRGGDALVYLEAEILHGTATLWSQVRMRSRSPEPDHHVVEARKLAGRGKGNVAALIARWEISPTEDKQSTHVVFSLLVDPALPVPDALVSYEMKRSAGKAFKALRKRVAAPASYAGAQRRTF